MQKNSFKNIVRVCYFTLYSIIFFSILFVCLKPDTALGLMGKGNDPKINIIVLSTFTLFTFFYILTTGLSVKNNFKISVSRFTAYTASFSVIAIFYSAVVTYFSGQSDELAILFFGMAFYLALAIFIAWIIWIINLIKFSKISFQKSKKISGVFKSLILALILIAISIFAVYLGISTGESFGGKQAKDAGVIWDIIYSQLDCETDSDCVLLANSGPFSVSLNKEKVEVVQQKAAEYCKKYNYGACKTQDKQNIVSSNSSTCISFHLSSSSDTEKSESGQGKACCIKSRCCYCE